jgi:Tfp pilus assembly protein PilX
MSRQDTNQAGFVLPMLLSFIIAISIVLSAVSLLLSANFQAANYTSDSQKALSIAESGINYYLWHLNHNPTDFRDGKNTPNTPDPVKGYGPYTHNYVDDNSKTTGTYTLWIKPQGNGSTVTTVRSEARLSGSNFTRTVEARMGAQSFAAYSVLSDSALWFGNNEAANGPVHSNQGVRMDGDSKDIVSSANATYVPPSNLGGNGSTSRPGVWCDSSITAPVNCNTRTKVDWLYPQPYVDFNQVTSSLCTIKRTAFSADASTSSMATNSNACNFTPANRTSAYIPRLSTSFSATKGYMIELLPTNSYNLYRVNSQDDRQPNYLNALSLQSVQSNIPIGTDGVIFVEDNVWVRSSPTFSGRVTIGAGRLASTSQEASITIADDLLYGTKNGSDVIGLISEQDVEIAPYAPPATGAFTFEVNAAIIAQKGSVVYKLFNNDANWNCSLGWKNSNQMFQFYGSVSTRQSWTWSWLLGSSACGDSVYDSEYGSYISGFKNSNTQYDYNLLYAPPPMFPLTGGYSILQWHEVLTRP